MKINQCLQSVCLISSLFSWGHASPQQCDRGGSKNSLGLSGKKGGKRRPQHEMEERESQMNGRGDEQKVQTNLFHQIPSFRDRVRRTKKGRKKKKKNFGRTRVSNGEYKSCSRRATTNGLGRHMHKVLRSCSRPDVAPPALLLFCRGVLHAQNDKCLRLCRRLSSFERKGAGGRQRPCHFSSRQLL